MMFTSNVRLAVEALMKGSLVIMPTDTVYGIAGHPMTSDVEKRLCEAKGRNGNKPIPLLAAGIEDVENCGAIFNDTERRLAARFWPGPLTLVLNVHSRHADAERRNALELPGGNDAEQSPFRRAEGFRVPDHNIIRSVLRDVGGILRVTSANISGESPALTAQDAACSLGRFVAVVLDAGPAPGNKPSAVVRVEHGTVKILREGAIPVRELREHG